MAGSLLPSARQLAWLLVQPTSALDPAATAVVIHVEQDEAAKAIADLARRFTALIRASGVDKTATGGRNGAVDFDPWMTDAKACGAPAIATFASGLAIDAGAVRAALTRALEQRPSRRPDQPTQADQAPKLRTSGPRSPQTAHGPRRLIHAK